MTTEYAPPPTPEQSAEKLAVTENERLRSQADADAAALETSRLARRAAVKARIAKAELAEQRWREADQAINDLNFRKESLAAAHVSTCAPLQAELAEIDTRQVEAQLAQQPRDETLETQRRELVKQLGDNNSALEAAIRVEDDQLNSLWHARREAGKESADIQATRELGELGRPDLLTTMHVVTSRHNAAVARLTRIVDHNPNRLSGAYLAAVLADAEAEVARTAQEVDQAHRAVIEE